MSCLETVKSELPVRTGGICSSIVRPRSLCLKSRKSPSGRPMCGLLQGTVRIVGPQDCELRSVPNGLCFHLLDKTPIRVEPCYRDREGLQLLRFGWPRFYPRMVEAATPDLCGCRESFPRSFC